MKTALWTAALLAAALAGSAACAAQPALPAYQIVAGKHAVYSVIYASTGEADFSPLLAENGPGAEAGAAPTVLSYRLAASLSGQMDVTVVAVTDAGVETWCVFRAPLVRLVINGQPQTGQATALASQLTRGFIVDLKPDGTIAQVRMGAGADISSQGFLRAFLALGQVVLPPSPATAGWEAREDDPNGPYTAQYRLEPDPARPGGWQVRKRIAGYLEDAAAPELPGETRMRQVVTPDLDLTARLDHGAVAQLVATDASATSVEGKPVAHSQSGLRLTRTALATLSPAALAASQARAGVLAASAVTTALFQPRSPKQVETRIETTELGDATPATLLARLAAVDGEGADADRSETDALYLKVKALAYLQPETSAPLGELLAKDPVAAPSFRLLAGALGAIGGPQAQTALAAAIRARPADWPALSALVPELCTLPAPTEDAEAAVRGLVASDDPNISAMAWLCLGGMARGLADAAPARGAAILDQLTQALAASADENAKALLMQALGNAGQAASAPALTPYATSASPVLRAAAMDALRAVPLPEVDPILRGALAADADPKVRTEAAFALGFRPPDAGLLAAEKAALATDQDPQVRIALLGDLAKLAAAFPEARQLIAAASEKDPSEDVRKTAAGLLQTLAAP